MTPGLLIWLVLIVTGVVGIALAIADPGVPDWQGRRPGILTGIGVSLVLAATAGFLALVIWIVLR